jgi:ribosomal protein S18 acetylase RimI-like enzyme
LGSQSLDLILASATAQTKPKIDKIYLHVQTSNDQAKKFYERHGFVEVELHKEYYKKIVPHDAWVLEKTLVPTKLNEAQ